MFGGHSANSIAAQFGVASDDVFTSWLEALVDLRNICAHHDRLFNRSFQKQPRRLRRASLPTGDPKKLKAILECLDYLLTQRGMNSQVSLASSRIIAKFPDVQPSEAGY